jgi:hypothetical protein
MAISLNPSKVPVSDSAREAILADPGFGKYFTDNMVTATWSSSSGWSEPLMDRSRLIQRRWFFTTGKKFLKA